MLVHTINLRELTMSRASSALSCLIFSESQPCFSSLLLSCILHGQILSESFSQQSPRTLSASGGVPARIEKSKVVNRKFLVSRKNLLSER